jgi:hypothetical protein
MLHQEIEIFNIVIRRDAEGRFCLNDLHKAAGGESRHQPGKWLVIQQTQELVQELSSIGFYRDKGIQPLKVKAGPIENGGGTYVVKELVYSYAMWISVIFKLQVIRAYDLKVQSQLTYFGDPILAARAWADAREAEKRANIISRQGT